MGSRSSSDRRGMAPRLVVVIAIGASLLAQACVFVRPEQRETLADPAMTFGGGEAQAQEDHILSNREGALGANASAGGGCGCN